MTLPREFIAKSHFDSLVILTRFLILLGFAPKYVEIENRFVITNLQKCWNFVVMMAIFGAYVVVVPQRIFMYQRVWTSWLILDVFGTASMLALNMLSIAETSYFDRKAFLSIFDSLSKVKEEFVKFGVKISQRRWNLARKLMTLHLGVLYTTAWSIYFSCTREDKVGKYGFFFMEIAQKYHNYNMIILMQHLLLDSKTQIENVNEILEMSSRERGDKGFLSEIDVNRLRNIYITILEQIQSYNKVFGKIIFIHFFLTVVSYLASTCTITVSKISLKLMGTGYMTTNIIHSSLILWMISTIAITCGSTTKAARETGPLCYVLCSKVRKSRQAPLYNELLTFARVASTSNPVISAAGFFDVDYAMLSNVFTILISYIIVILQLYR